MVTQAELDVLVPKLIKNPLREAKQLSVETLTALIRYAKERYHNDDPLFDDDIYDIIEDHFMSLNPTSIQNGAPLREDIVKTELPFYMGSQTKIKDSTLLLDKWMKKYPGDYYTSDKLDGVSGLLYIRPKLPPQLFTRGNGHTGQDISHLIKYILKGMKISKSNKQTIAIRGEFIMKKTSFTQLGKGANPRNLVSGFINRKSLDTEMAKLVDFVAYEVVEPKITLDAAYKLIAATGINVVHHTHMDTVSIDGLSNELATRRIQSEYDIDGIVVQHNAIHEHPESGNPDYSFAFKTMIGLNYAEVLVQEVEWNASKHGLLKPTVIFKPVNISGVNIGRATGFNAKYIVENKIGPGAHLKIVRSGDVIPYISEVLKPSSPQYPSKAYKWNDTNVDFLLSDTEDADQQQKKLEAFASKSGIHVVGLGPGLIQRLYAAGYTTIQKLLTVTKADLLKVEGFKEKSAQTLVDEIAKAIQAATCLQLMVASGIFGQGFGHRKLKLILDHIPDIVQRPSIDLADLQLIEGIGEKTGKQFIDNMPKFQEYLKEIGLSDRCNVATGVKAGPSVEKTEVVATDESFVFTGERSQELEAAIEAAGGRVVTSVSKKTTYVVAKDVTETTGKLGKARELGVKIISMADCKKRFQIV